jgi:hypothetical protein
MAFGEIFPLTPEGEEETFPKVTEATAGVVISVTMVTGTFEEFFFFGNSTSIFFADAESPEGNGNTAYEPIV